MRQTLLIILAVFCFASCKKNDRGKQDPIPHNQALSWVKTYGGTEYDFANSVTQLQNGDYIFAGNTRSIDGDVPGTRWGYDAWLTRVDNNGNKLWSQTYGDHDDDYATAVSQTADGGFLVTGYTFNNYNYASWVLKTDAYGAKQWQKEISASTDSRVLSMVPNGDGNYLVAGYTSTGGNRDGFIKKIDASGNQVWMKTMGGSGEDWITSVVRNADGTITASGYTSSENGDLSGNKGNFDGWLIQLDASGNKIWSRNFGGSGDDFLNGIIHSADGWIAAGYTRSGDGDIEHNNGGFDEWIIKIDNSGNKVWVKTYGGGNEEYVSAIANGTANDGSFITLGYSNSTTGDVTRANNNFSGWLLKLDANGNKTAASTYGHTSLYDDKTNTLIPTQDGGYLIGGYSWDQGRGYDGWLVKIDQL